MEQKIKKILILYTGGTIGMQETAFGLTTDETSIARYVKKTSWGQQVDLITLSPLIDSSILDFSHWNQWLGKIYERGLSYQGIVVLHGTDTLVYTAAMLAIMLSHLPIPVIVTGAIKRLGAPASDAVDNLYAAFFAAKALSSGVFIVFNKELFSPFDCVKVNTQDAAAFIAPNGTRYGKYQRQNWDFDEAGMVLPKIDFKINSRVIFSENTNILNLYITPHLVNNLPEIIQVKHWDGIILQTFGNGNLQLTESLEKCLKKYIEKGNPVIIVSQVLMSEVNNNYALSHNLDNLGCISGRTLNIETIFTLLATYLNTPYDKNKRHILLQEAIEQIDQQKKTFKKESTTYLF